MIYAIEHLSNLLVEKYLTWPTQVQNNRNDQTTLDNSQQIALMHNNPSTPRISEANAQKKFTYSVVDKDKMGIPKITIVAKLEKWDFPSDTTLEQFLEIYNSSKKYQCDQNQMTLLDTNVEYQLHHGLMFDGTTFKELKLNVFGWAAATKNIQLLNKLIGFVNNKADLKLLINQREVSVLEDQSESYGPTALMMACSVPAENNKNVALKMVKSLINAGADVNLTHGKAGEGATALWKAASVCLQEGGCQNIHNGSPEMTQELLRNNAKLSLQYKIATAKVFDEIDICNKVNKIVNSKKPGFNENFIRVKIDDKFKIGSKEAYISGNLGDGSAIYGNYDIVPPNDDYMTNRVIFLYRHLEPIKESIPQTETWERYKLLKITYANENEYQDIIRVITQILHKIHLPLNFWEIL